MSTSPKDIEALYEVGYDFLTNNAMLFLFFLDFKTLGTIWEHTLHHMAFGWQRNGGQLISCHHAPLLSLFCLYNSNSFSLLFNVCLVFALY